MSVFETLNAINVNEHTEKKNGLTYLSWAWAWAEFCKVYPMASYKVYKNENGLPYVYDPNTGYMCFVEVTVDDITHEMWLPVMDSANHAMKSEPYEVKTKYKTIRVEAATMFDINKTIMRCLVKCLAMFGLGIYIYSGEDLPEAEKPIKLTEEDRLVFTDKISILVEEQNLDLNKIYKKVGVESFNDIATERLPGMVDWLQTMSDKQRKELAK